MPSARIISVAHYLPDRVLTNFDLEQMVDTSDEWIRERTGIQERRIAADDETAADMGAAAARKALAQADLTAEDVDLLIVTTATPDRWLPATACDVQDRIGASNAFAFDLSAACSGFVYAVSMAEGHLAAGRAKTVLVVSTEKMSSILDWEDRTTCILFGDAAGAAVLQPADDSDRGVMTSYMRSDGSMAELLWRPGGGSACPLTEEVVRNREHLMRMAGREIFKNAVRAMADASTRVIEQAGLSADDIDLLVPHQANIRIIDATARYAGIPSEKVFVNLDRYGNTSSATIPIALAEAEAQGRIGPGSVVLLTTFGAGLTWGAMLVRW